MTLLKDLEKAFQIKIALEPGEPSWTAMFLCQAAEKRRAEVRKAIEEHAPLSPTEAGVALYALDEAVHGYSIERFTVPPKWETKSFEELKDLFSDEDGERDGDNNLIENYIFVRSLTEPHEDVTPTPPKRDPGHDVSGFVRGRRRRQREWDG